MHHDLPAHVVAGGLAGALSAAVTNPLDVIKTRLQTQSVLLNEIVRCPSLPLCCCL